MLIAPQHRDKLNTYCMVRKVNQEVAVKEMIGEALERFEQDPVVKAKLDRARELKAALDAL